MPLLQFLGGTSLVEPTESLLPLVPVADEVETAGAPVVVGRPASGRNASLGWDWCFGSASSLCRPDLVVSSVVVPPDPPSTTKHSHLQL